MTSCEIKFWQHFRNNFTEFI